MTLTIQDKLDILHNRIMLEGSNYPATEKQVRFIAILIQKVAKKRPDRIAILRVLVDKPYKELGMKVDVSSTKDITKRTASIIIDTLIDPETKELSHDGKELLLYCSKLANSDRPRYYRGTDEAKALDLFPQEEVYKTWDAPNMSSM